MKRLLIFIISAVFAFAAFSLSVSAADASTAAVETVAEETISEPATNVYYIIEGLWSYIYPPEVIEANANIIAFYTMTLTALFVVLPFIIIYSYFFKRRK